MKSPTEMNCYKIYREYVDRYVYSRLFDTPLGLEYRRQSKVILNELKRATVKVYFEYGYDLSKDESIKDIFMSLKSMHQKLEEFDYDVLKYYEFVATWIFLKTIYEVIFELSDVSQEMIEIDTINYTLDLIRRGVPDETVKI